MTVAADPTNPNGAPRQSWVTRVVRLTRKELRETLRDRRTIITLVLMPLLLYPLISVVFTQFMLLNSSVAGKTVQWNVAVRHPEDFDTLMGALKVGEDWLRKRGEVRAVEPEKSNATPAIPSLTEAAISEPQLDSIAGQFDDNITNLYKVVEHGDADVAVLLTRNADERGQFHADLIFQPNSSYGRELARYIDRRVRAANEALLYRRLQQLGGEAVPQLTSKLKPLEIRDESISQWRYSAAL